MRGRRGVVQVENVAPIPRPGDLLGWVILYGPKRDHAWFVPAVHGASAAPEKVTHNHLENAVILRAVVG